MEADSGLWDGQMGEKSFGRGLENHGEIHDEYRLVVVDNGYTHAIKHDTGNSLNIGCYTWKVNNKWQMFMNFLLPCLITGGGIAKSAASFGSGNRANMGRC